jgi:ornithine cyclodeaminase
MPVPVRTEAGSANEPSNRGAMRILPAGDIVRALPPKRAIEILERTFRAPLPPLVARTHVELGGGTLLMMPAQSASGVAGVKLATVNTLPAAGGVPRVQGVYVLFARESLTPLAVLDASALTRIRTAAVSALATKYLVADLHAPATLVVFGTGPQAFEHITAIAQVVDVACVYVVARIPGREEPVLAHARSLGLDAQPASRSIVERATIVCTCTSSAVPVFAGKALRPGTHVNAVGTYTPDRRELDDDAIAAGPIVVESREAALAESGDLIIPLERGVIGPSAIAADLHELLNGAPVRRSLDDVTIFKSVGIALEDLLLAEAIVNR